MRGACVTHGCHSFQGVRTGEVSEFFLKVACLWEDQHFLSGTGRNWHKGHTRDTSARTHTHTNHTTTHIPPHYLHIQHTAHTPSIYIKHTDTTPLTQTHRHTIHTHHIHTKHTDTTPLTHRHTDTDTHTHNELKWSQPLTPNPRWHSQETLKRRPEGTLQPLILLSILYVPGVPTLG